MRPMFSALVLLTACTEYGLGKQTVPPAGADPDIATDPELISEIACASPWDGVVTARNDGDGPAPSAVARSLGRTVQPPAHANRR